PGELDVDRCAALVAEARALEDAEERAERLRAALALWRGEPLAEFRYDDFAQAEIARLSDLRLAALEERTEADLELERHEELLRELGAEAYAQALSEHRRALRTAFEAHGGVEIDTQGDAFFVAFPTAPGALAAAAATIEKLSESPIRVRIGIHTGTPHLTDE